MAATIVRRFSVVPLALAAMAIIVLAGGIGLWGYYGTTVFFEMIRAGWVACF